MRKVRRVIIRYIPSRISERRDFSRQVRVPLPEALCTRGTVSGETEFAIDSLPPRVAAAARLRRGNWPAFYACPSSRKWTWLVSRARACGNDDNGERCNCYNEFI